MREPTWHCFFCGAGGLTGHFCNLCGGAQSAFWPAYKDFQEHEQFRLEMELEGLNFKMLGVLTTEERWRRREIVSRLGELSDARAKKLR